MTIAKQRWGVELIGHPFDLADWREVLKRPFDPWVSQTGEQFVLRSCTFDDLQSWTEVRDSASYIVDQLNGAMQIIRHTAPVHAGCTIEFKADGTRLVLLSATGAIEGRMRACDTAVTEDDADTRNALQEWTSLSESHEVLADALVYFSRSEWFDIYKAVECVEDFVGGEAVLRSLNWINAKDFKRLKRTANAFRHRTGGKGTSSEPQLTRKEALDMLALLIPRAFAWARTKSSPV